MVKKIGEVVDEKINKALEPVNKKLDALWDQTADLTVNMTAVQETQKSHTKILKSHTNLLNSHTKALSNLEANTASMAGNIRKLNKRLKAVEDKSGLVPPPELSL